MFKNITGGVNIDFFGLLTILLVALKLTNYIDWSWLLVFSPLIAGSVIGILLFVICLIIVTIS
jgi:hypothetical protein